MCFKKISLKVSRMYQESLKEVYIAISLHGSHLKPYLTGFIFSHGSKFLGAPFMVKNWFQVNCKSFFGFKDILGHEGGTQIFRAMAHNKAIQIKFQMIEKKNFLCQVQEILHPSFYFSKFAVVKCRSYILKYGMLW